ncbi:MAG: hypothetical protein MUP09_08980 [Thiovulaceae bacterium]|nr:hypothetical protein [Sulfurimonadaceae bacterium]
MKLNKNYLLFLITFFLIILVLIFIIFQFNREVSWQVIENVNDQFSLSLRKELDEEKEDALRFGIVLAQNGDIRSALAGDDEEMGFAALRQVMGTVQKHMHTLVRAQILTADHRIFARSWDDENLYAGMPLDAYRSDLDYFKTHRDPRVSIEVGRRLGIKATVPIYDKNKLLGFVEVLQFFDASTDFFHKFGIDLYVLLDDSYYNTAVLMQNNPTAAWYIVANRGYNMVNLKTLQRVDFKKLRKEHVLLQNNKYIFYEPMHNGQAETIGAFVFMISKKELEHFANSGEEISFLLAFSRSNLYDIVKKEQYENKVYHSGYDKALLSLKDTVPEEDRELFMEEARDALSSYTKEELIAMMLRYKLSRRIEGEIR